MSASCDKGTEGCTDSSKIEGTNGLIQQGVRLVMNVDDILSEFQLQPPLKQVELLPDLSSKEELVFQKVKPESHPY